MEAEELTVGRVHHGHNIRRFRIEKNMNQEVLSQLVHLSQSAVSKYEQMRVIDDEMLHIGSPFRVSEEFGRGCADGGV
jgi:transcriptional regulator with XRE-family HTH domain